MIAGSLVLSNSSFVGSSQGTAVQWQGGRTVLVVTATAYGGADFLQYLGPDGVTWINVNSTTYSANQITEYALPRGWYKFVNGQSSSVGVYATLVSMPYA